VPLLLQWSAAGNPLIAHCGNHSLGRLKKDDKDITKQIADCLGNRTSPFAWRRSTRSAHAAMLLLFRSGSIAEDRRLSIEMVPMIEDRSRACGNLRMENLVAAKPRRC